MFSKMVAPAGMKYPLYVSSNIARFGSPSGTGHPHRNTSFTIAEVYGKSAWSGKSGKRSLPTTLSNSSCALLNTWGLRAMARKKVCSKDTVYRQPCVSGSTSQLNQVIYLRCPSQLVTRSRSSLRILQNSPNCSPIYMVAVAPRITSSSNPRFSAKHDQAMEALPFSLDLTQNKLYPRDKKLYRAHLHQLLHVFERFMDDHIKFSASDPREGFEPRSGEPIGYVLD